MPRRLTSSVVLAGLAGTAWLVHRLARRSGVTTREARQPLPGDAIVDRPWWVSTRAVSIDAPPSAVWPWVVQMGYPTERAGWYTPHWLDELMWGARPHSADEIRPELQDVEVGDLIPDSPDWTAKYVVEEVAPPSHLVLHSTWHVIGPVRESDFSWAFVLQPLGAAVAGDAAPGVAAPADAAEASAAAPAVDSAAPAEAPRTRLVVRARVAYTPRRAFPFVEAVIGLGDWANVSVMLRGIKQRAERTGR